MPKKIRELKAMLLKAGFLWEPGKGSHTKWTHPELPQFTIILSGNDGDDARRYQEKSVASALQALQQDEESLLNEESNNGES
ncbi:type II toxin-antitoxin system HicA family toxin [Gloeobacter kilaueensis]|uniref:YcfA family protein n=1 Tax=Gloeobacter kilaueensis (strain ATCC BAA-2537 / CCAP 1431/1 / ULC 316 / JS1) TaxID=1183438 RepID=U5QD96_GLOK1|nr:type II toxin-antitoxin system HicA family toxin [Gloeobacter kilaueensis]AGY56892.1 YcfA family protein [Gloeobacter kilaueensis JS1]